MLPRRRKPAKMPMQTHQRLFTVAEPSARCAGESEASAGAKQKTILRIFFKRERVDIHGDSESRCLSPRATLEASQARAFSEAASAATHFSIYSRNKNADELQFSLNHLHKIFTHLPYDESIETQITRFFFRFRTSFD